MRDVNYFMLFLRYLKSTFSLYLYLFLTFAPLIIGALGSNSEKGIDGLGSLGSKHPNLDALLKTIEEFGEYLTSFVNLFHLSKDATDLVALGLYSVIVYVSFRGILFVITEIIYYPYRKKGMNTQEILKELERQREESKIPHKDDY